MRPSSASRCSSCCNLPARFRSERDDLLQRPAVFALERMDQIQPLLHLAKACGVEINGVGVVSQGGLQFAPGGGGLLMGSEQTSRAGVNALQGLQRPAQFAGLGQEANRPARPGGSGRPGSIRAGGRRCWRAEIPVPAAPLRPPANGRRKSRVPGNGATPIAARRSRSSTISAAFSASNSRSARGQGGELRAQAGQAGKGIENVPLPGRVEQRLVIVRAVHVHPIPAERGQHLQRGRGAVDELAVGAGGGEDAFENQFPSGARFQAVFLQEFVERGAAFAAPPGPPRPSNCRSRRE